MLQSHSLHWQIRRMFQCMMPYDVVGIRKRRIGGMRDGGYVMLDDFSSTGAAYSLGVGGDVSWDLEMAQQGISIHQYDHTVPGPPTSHPLFEFSKKGIGPIDKDEFVSIGSILKANGHANRRDLILKIDIECAEWEALDAVSDEDLNRFEQIVAEFHGFLRVGEPAWRELTCRVLGRLLRTHAVYHVHANNWGEFQVIEGVPVPDVLELSYVRRDRAKLVSSSEFFPTYFDTPCNPERPEIILGSFRFF
jgi:hypothetical protein